MISDDAVEGSAPAVAETHSGIVVFIGDRAYKLKKPIDLGFLDFRSRETREAICHREVALNRRLAPDVYLGVSDVLDTSGGVCDHLIVMRRMPTARRLSTLVETGEDIDHNLGAVARLLAGFHARAERGAAIDAAAGVDALSARWASNTAGLEPFCGQFVTTEDVEAVDAMAQRYLQGRRALFDHRIARGRSCDGHGDLLADDIFCLDDGPRVLDCIEFDDALRYGDALADVAFLAMDLERRGHPELAVRFLELYQEHSDDAWPASLAHHHIAYRAQVRAKVAAIRADQGHTASVQEARQHLDLARRHLEDARVRLILVGGLPGTGKSTLAAGIGEELGAVVLRSDEIRKELAGIPTDQPAGDAFQQGIYGPAATTATYEELLTRAKVALRFGETVIADASWTDRGDRERARDLAAETYSDLVELRCDAPPDVAIARMQSRSRRGGDPSDADSAIFVTMSARFDTWAEASVVDTTGGVDRAVATALRSISPAPLEDDAQAGPT